MNHNWHIAMIAIYAVVFGGAWVITLTKHYLEARRAAPAGERADSPPVKQVEPPIQARARSKAKRSAPPKLPPAPVPTGPTHRASSGNSPENDEPPHTSEQAIRTPSLFEQEYSLDGWIARSLPLDDAMSSLNPFTGLDDDPFGEEEIEQLIALHMPIQPGRRRHLPHSVRPMRSF